MLKEGLPARWFGESAMFPGKETWWTQESDQRLSQSKDLSDQKIIDSTKNRFSQENIANLLVCIVRSSVI